MQSHASLEYGKTLHSGVVLSLDNLQTWIEHTRYSTFQSLLHSRNAAIIGLVCHLLAWEGLENLQKFCPLFWNTDENCRHWSSHLHDCHPAEHLHFVDQFNFWTLDRF